MTTPLGTETYLTMKRERDEARTECQSWHDKYVLADTQRDDARAMLAEATTLLQRFVPVLKTYAYEPCAMANGIACSMVPAGSLRVPCGPCQARIALILAVRVKPASP